MKIAAIPFYGHTKPNGWMSNFYPSEIHFNGKIFKTSEHLFMWKKAMYFKDYICADRILDTKTPTVAKNLGRLVKKYHEEQWVNYRGIAMTSAVYHKFSQNEDLKELLLNTGDYFLVEATKNDKVWGIGLDVDDPLLYDDDNWKGLNLLGSCLMTVRTMLREKEAKE